MIGRLPWVARADRRAERAMRRASEWATFEYRLELARIAVRRRTDVAIPSFARFARELEAVVRSLSESMERSGAPLRGLFSNPGDRALAEWAAIVEREESDG